MPGAQLRNTVPKALELPAIAEEGALLVHEVSADEQEGFQLASRVYTNDKVNQYWSFDFETGGQALDVFFTYGYYEHGMPKRDGFRRKIATLGMGETLSFHINGRFAGYSGQHYRQTVLNIAYGITYPSVFLEGKFDHQIDKMADLF